MAEVPPKCLPGDAAALPGTRALTCMRPTSPWAHQASRRLPICTEGKERFARVEGRPVLGIGGS